MPGRPPVTRAGLTAPCVEYKHAEGKSVTAGPVYRGQQLPGLRDRLVYGDFVSGHVWALPADRSPRPRSSSSTELAIVSFGESLDERADPGRLRRGPAAQGGRRGRAGAGLPTQLSQTGCLDRGRGRRRR